MIRTYIMRTGPNEPEHDILVLMHRRAANAQARLRICADSPEPSLLCADAPEHSLLAYTKYGCR